MKFIIASENINLQIWRKKRPVSGKLTNKQHYLLCFNIPMIYEQRLRNNYNTAQAVLRSIAGRHLMSSVSTQKISIWQMISQFPYVASSVKSINFRINNCTVRQSFSQGGSYEPHLIQVKLVTLLVSILSAGR